MILETMLQRLYQSLLKGPSLNARPHNSRQRVDVMELCKVSGLPSNEMISKLLSDGVLEVPAVAERFKRPDYPEAEWSDEEKAKRDAWEKQVRLLRKLGGIAEDAKEYFNDHGEEALYVGYPLLSLPPNDNREGLGSSRVLAPLAMIPIKLKVRSGARAGVTIETTAEGVDRVIPNPALLAWIERMTGTPSEDIFADESGDEPWVEIKEILDYVAKGVGFSTGEPKPTDKLEHVSRADALPDKPELLSSAVLGLFPMRNPGLIRDTQWMMSNEKALSGPIRSFLVREAIYGDEPQEMPPAEEIDIEEQAKFERDFNSEFLITRADPCQAAAVEEAAKSQALVVHGPPGTGKSQTIANIIGDHLARGERVLFVCDKRTALDVVKYRLDALGIGHLCGVIHDPQRDRKDFYMGLRQRLEDLVELDIPPDVMPALKRVNERLVALHRELRDAYASLHTEDAEGESFHSIVGKWMELACAATLKEDANQITNDIVEKHRADVSEVCTRAIEANLTGNVLLDHLSFDLTAYLSAKPGEIEQKLRSFAKAIELPGDGSDLPALPDGDLLGIADARERASVLLSSISDEVQGPLVGALLRAGDISRMQSEWDDFASMRQALADASDRELKLQILGAQPSLAVINSSLVALKEYEEASLKWTKVFAFGKKKEASKVLSSLGLKLDKSMLDRAISFYERLKAEIVVGDFVTRLTEKEVQYDDGQWVATLETLDATFEIISLIDNDSVLNQNGLRNSLVESGSSNYSELLDVSSKRARMLYKAVQDAATHGLLREDALLKWEIDMRSGSSGTELGRGIDHSCNHLEGVLRVQDCLGRLPDALGPAARSLALSGLDVADALVSLTRTAIENRIREMIAEKPELARIDTTRVDAAFDELSDRIFEKQQLVQQAVVRYWQDRQSRRVLASTRSRLNSEGAMLRQRLYVRGKKALRLRQMIDAGSHIEGGDPLFDLCPVWMASPDTVAQIFPREALFDVVVFDEASQCRLEEALPVMLRAKRLVVAGDPKQLPPTRFFESAVIDSDNQDFEDEEDLHAAQMSEMEDLLSAALNLDVSESFLDVHYRSRNEALIGFSNQSFYGHRLQPIPGHPKNKALNVPIRLDHVNGTYTDQTNPAEAMAVVERIKEMLEDEQPPSIGVATFNLKQRNLILEMLSEKAADNMDFSRRLEQARRRKGSDSFEGLFVKNLENVQGDERDVIIVSTTFGRDEEGKFRRNFGALSRIGGERRLNVLVTRARSEIHLFTSIPREEYQAGLAAAGDTKPNGRVYLYSYLCYAERLEAFYKRYQDELETMRASEHAECEIMEIRQPSLVAQSLGEELKNTYAIGSTVHWGNDGFSVDVALTHPAMPEDVTIGILADFNRYRNTPDPIDWELFRTNIHRSQGWDLERIWSPRLFRDISGEMTKLGERHHQAVKAGMGGQVWLDEQDQSQSSTS